MGDSAEGLETIDTAPKCKKFLSEPHHCLRAAGSQPPPHWHRRVAISRGSAEALPWLTSASRDICLQMLCFGLGFCDLGLHQIADGHDADQPIIAAHR